MSIKIKSQYFRFDFNTITIWSCLKIRHFSLFLSFVFSLSLGNLQFLSQIGLILFMFVIGMELDLKVLKNKANDAIVISHASIVTPPK